ncbi:MAG: hypothetical protein ACKOSO_02990 [Actinomycetota bacterium]
MAHDLTPRAPDLPAVDTEPLVQPDPDQVRTGEEPIVEHMAVRERSYRGRFLVAYGILGVVAGVALVVFLASLGFSRPEPGPPWSGFVPVETADQTMIQSIADHVGGRYALPDGAQLGAVTASKPEWGGVPLAAIAVQPASGAVDQTIRVIEADSAVSYVLCGLGEQCAIASGKPSVERDRLLRREALELALYTFRYVPGVEQVLAFLPPKKGSPPDVALLFERGQYAGEIDQPLDRTLPPSVPGVESMPTSEQQVVDRLTEPRRYAFQMQELQDGSPVIVLSSFS